MKRWTGSHRTKLSRFKIWPAPTRMLKEYVDKTCKILENGINDAEDESVERDTMMYLYGKQIKMLLLLWKHVPFLRWFCKWIMKRFLSYYDRLLQYPFSRFMYRTYYLFPSRYRNLIHAVVEDIEPDAKTGLYGNLQHEWDICMETPNFFDARMTLKNRIEQIEILKKKGSCFDRDSVIILQTIIDSMENLRADVN